MTERTDVILIGAGVAGLFASLQMAQRGIACTILDTYPPAAFASTRNQGWLHQGAFSASAAKDPITARACRAGYRWIQSHYPNVIRPDIPCYFLMYKEEDLQQSIELCRQEDISVRPIPINTVKEREPILKNSPLAYAMQTSDTPVDTSRLLQAVLDEAYQRGVRFQGVKSLEAIRPMWDGQMWHVCFDQEHEIQARAVVLTCGVAIPEMVQRFLPAAPTRFMRTKIPVVVLRGDVAGSMLITLYAPLVPHLVPFNDRDGNGASICIAYTDRAISDYRDTALPDNFLAQCQESFTEFYGGIPTQMIEHGALQGHVYVCQKLHLRDNLADHPISRVAIHLSYAPQPGGQKNLFVFYPGKFTAAPIAAVTCAEEVEWCLGDQRVCGTQSAGVVSVPAVARQRYYDNSGSMLAVRDGKLVMKTVIHL